MWRSLAAHLLWEQGVGSSNLPIPTTVVLRDRLNATVPVWRTYLTTSVYASTICSGPIPPQLNSESNWTVGRPAVL